MKIILALVSMLLAACSLRITLEEAPENSGVLAPALCSSGEPAVTFWEVTSMLTGEDRAFNLSDGATHAGKVYLRPGGYRVEAGCNRMDKECGLMKGWIYVGRAPTVEFSVTAGELITLDCDPDGTKLFVRRERPN